MKIVTHIHYATQRTGWNDGVSVGDEDDDCDNDCNDDLGNDGDNNDSGNGDDDDHGSNSGNDGKDDLGNNSGNGGDDDDESCGGDNGYKTMLAIMTLELMTSIGLNLKSHYLPSFNILIITVNECNM